MNLSGIVGAVIEIMLCFTITFVLLILINLRNPALKKVIQIMVNFIKRR
jgi:hypothetical protein